MKFCPKSAALCSRSDCSPGYPPPPHLTSADVHILRADASQ
jgi:hypothetical protein